MHELVTDLFAQAAQHAMGHGMRMGADLAMRGLRKTPLGKYLPSQAKVADEKRGGR